MIIGEAGAVKCDPSKADVLADGRDAGSPAEVGFAGLLGASSLSLLYGRFLLSLLNFPRCPPPPPPDLPSPVNED